MTTMMTDHRLAWIGEFVACRPKVITDHRLRQDLTFPAYARSLVTLSRGGTCCNVGFQKNGDR